MRRFLALVIVLVVETLLVPCGAWAGTNVSPTETCTCRCRPSIHLPMSACSAGRLEVAVQGGAAEARAPNRVPSDHSVSSFQGGRRDTARLRFSRVKPNAINIQWPSRGQQVRAGRAYDLAAWFAGPQDVVRRVEFELSSDDAATFVPAGTATYAAESETYFLRDIVLGDSVTHVRSVAHMKDGFISRDTNAVTVHPWIDAWFTHWDDPSKWADTTGQDWHLMGITEGAWLATKSNRVGSGYGERNIRGYALRLARGRPGRRPAFLWSHPDFNPAYMQVTIYDNPVRNPEGTVNASIDTPYPDYSTGMERLRDRLKSVFAQLQPVLRRVGGDINIDWFPLDGETTARYHGPYPDSVDAAYRAAVQNDPRWPATYERINALYQRMGWPGSFDMDSVGLSRVHSRAFERSLQELKWPTYERAFREALENYFPNAVYTEYAVTDMDYSENPSQWEQGYRAGLDYNGNNLFGQGLAPYGVGTHQQYLWRGTVRNMTVPGRRHHVWYRAPMTGFVHDLARVRAMWRSDRHHDWSGITVWLHDYTFWEPLKGVRPPRMDRQYYWSNVVHSLLHTASSPSDVAFELWQSYYNAANERWSIDEVVRYDHQLHDTLAHINARLGNERRELVTTDSIANWYASAYWTGVRASDDSVHYFVTPSIGDTTDHATTLFAVVAGEDVPAHVFSKGTAPGQSTWLVYPDEVERFWYEPEPERNLLESDLTLWSQVGRGAMQLRSATGPEEGTDATLLRAGPGEATIADTVHGLQPDQWYALSYWARSHAGEMAGAPVVAADAAGRRIASAHARYDGAWRFYEMVFQAPGDGTVLVKLEAKGNAWKWRLHDLRLEEGERPVRMVE